MKQPNYKLGNHTLIWSAILVAIFFLLCLTSCGSRKVNKSKTEIKETQTTEATFKDSSKTTNIVNRNIKYVDTGSVEEIEFIPVDNTKEMVINGKTYFNTTLKAKKIRNNKVLNKTENVSQIKQNDIKTATKENMSKVAVTDVKNTYKKQFNFLSLWWLLLVIPIYLLWRKYGSYL